MRGFETFTRSPEFGAHSSCFSICRCIAWVRIAIRATQPLQGDPQSRRVRSHDGLRPVSEHVAGQQRRRRPVANYSLNGNNLLLPFNDPSTSSEDAADWDLTGDCFGGFSPGVHNGFSGTDYVALRGIGYTGVAAPAPIFAI